jgi:hypothetical protein
MWNAVYQRTDNKGVIRSSISKDRQYNDQKKKGQTMIYKTLHRRTDNVMAKRKKDKQ